MTRDEALSYLNSQFSSITCKLDFTTVDTPFGYGPIINQALLAVGVPPEEWTTTEPDDTAAYLAALDYYAIRTFYRQAITLTDTTIDGVPIHRSQMVAHLKAMLADAESAAASAGIDVPGGVPDIVMGGIMLDFLEPADV